MKKTWKRIVLTIGIVVALGLGAFLIYVNDYYEATEFVDEMLSMSIHSIEDVGRYTLIVPYEESNNIGIIFYPGGKVEARAYIGLLLQLADQGVTSILVNMPFNLAVFDINAADEAQKLVSNVDSWYMVGHSLGGAMASSYIKDNTDAFEGLVLLAAYPINDSKIKTIQIVGSEDGILDFTKLDDEVETYVIDGGNHAFFGDYGEQKGDGNASISKEQQQSLTIQKILEFMSD